jgi:hypothetical protein
MSTNQTGHEQNVVNLGIIITRVSTFQTGYNPSRAAFTIPGLSELKTNGENVINSWNLAENVFKKSIAARTLAFSGFDSLITRSINALRISGASEQTIEQAEALVRELRGGRASDRPTDEEIEEAKANGGDLSQNVVHNSTFDSKIENFKKYVQFLGLVGEYNPNEADLKIEALNTRFNVLKTANDDYNSTDAALNAARLRRNSVLYANTTGLVDISLGVKLYVKSAYGATSPEYKSISDIQFTKQK